MATDLVVRLRCSEAQKEAWGKAAGEDGFSAWARRALDARVELDGALLRQERGDDPVAVWREEQIRANAEPPSGLTLVAERLAGQKLRQLRDAAEVDWLQSHGWRGPDPKGGRR